MYKKRKKIKLRQKLKIIGQQQHQSYFEKFQFEA